MNDSSSPRVLFACYHFYLDPSNGASITAREILLALREQGWNVSTFCGCGLDFQQQTAPLQLIYDRGITPKRIVKNDGSLPFSLAHFHDSGIASNVFLPEENKLIPSKEAGLCYLRLLETVIKQTRPEVLVTYGGYWMAGPLLNLARSHDVKTVVLLQNFAYTSAEYFRAVDRIIVPSRFASEYYRKKLGIYSVPIPPLIHEEAVLCSTPISERKYVTFVNPAPNKGLYIFVQIAKQLWEQRPDIPLLVVEGRCGAKSLAHTGLDLKGLKNLNLMANTPDPRHFYKLSKIMLVPSVRSETFGRVAAEGMICGIPVIGSDRGAIPEVIGNAGVTISIPKKYTPETRTVASPEEVRDWINAIVQLWDDATRYADFSQRSLIRARTWSQETVGKQYDRCLRELRNR